MDRNVNPMKRIFLLIFIFLLAFTGCVPAEPPAQIAATTLPVYEFTLRLCEGTDLTVTRLVTESVSCLHDYSLDVRQARAAEGAEIIVLSGAGLEEFLEDLLAGKEAAIDASAGIPLICPSEEHHHEEHHDHEGHNHAQDPHIWLSPANAKIMAQNICAGLIAQYPRYADIFAANLEFLLADLDTLQHYGETQLAQLSCRELITFHDGFAYFADAFGLTILEAVEEESGSEASALELKTLITLTREHKLPAIFIETNGSCSAAEVIARETGAGLYTLDMAMSGSSYFEAMYRNIDTIKEALE